MSVELGPQRSVKKERSLIGKKEGRERKNGARIGREETKRV